MTSESSMYLIVDPKDIECGICYQSYSHSTNQAMLLPCDHSICSTCLPNLSSCPHCRKRISQTPAKNMLVASFIEKDSQTKKCPTHKKPKDYFSNKSRRLVCCDCLLEEHKQEFQPIQKIESKVKEMKAHQKTIHTKKQESQLKIQESLNKRRENLDTVVDILLEEELAYIFSLKKKIKSVLEVCFFTDKDRYEYQLLAENLSKHEEKTQEMLEKWDNNQQEGDVAAKILDAPLEIESFMEKYEDREKEILEDIHEEEKSFEEILQESRFSFAPRTINTRELLEKLQSKAQAELNLKYSAIIATDYLLRTLKDYGIQYEYKAPNQPIILKENSFFTNLNKFYPKFFECSLEKLHISCISLSDSRFKTLCEILQNIQNLSDVNITFEKISFEKAELLSNFVLQSKALHKFSTKMPLLKDSHDDPFEKFVQMTFPLKNLSTLNLNYFPNDTSIFFEKNPSQAPPILKECSMKFSRRNLMLHFATSVILPNLNFYKSIQKIQLSFAKDVIYAQFLQDLCQILRSLENLQEFDLGFANTWQLKNHGLAGQISKIISFSKSLTKVSLFLVGRALSKENVFDDLFSLLHQRPDVPRDHQLEEFTLTLMGCNEVDIPKIVSYLESFPKLKNLVLRIHQINLSFGKLKEFLKEISRLKSLSSLEIVCRGCGELNLQQKQDLERRKRQLPTSIIQSNIVFEGLMAHHVPDYVEIGPENQHENEGYREEAYNNYQRDLEEIFAN